MRKLGLVTLQFIPAQITRDDPMAQCGYLSWKAIIDGKQYGTYTKLTTKDKELSADILTPFLADMQTTLLDLLAMTPEQVAESDAKIKAEADAREAAARAYWDSKPESERLV